MKRMIVGAAVAAIAALSYVAISADAPDRPDGVSARNWIAVSDRLGIVLVDSKPTPMGAVESGPIDPSRPVQIPPGSVPLLLTPPVGGYFMVKGASGWSRLVVVEPLKGPAGAG